MHPATSACAALPVRKHSDVDDVVADDASVMKCDSSGGNTVNAAALPAPLVDIDSACVGSSRSSADDRGAMRCSERDAPRIPTRAVRDHHHDDHDDVSLAEQRVIEIVFSSSSGSDDSDGCCAHDGGGCSDPN